MSTQREPLKPEEIKAITNAARNAPLVNMRHASALEALCQKLEAYFAPASSDEPPLPGRKGDGVQSRSQRRPSSKAKAGGKR